MRKRIDLYLDRDVFDKFSSMVENHGLSASRVLELYMRQTLRGEGNIVRGMVDELMEKMKELPKYKVLKGKKLIGALGRKVKK